MTKKLMKVLTAEDQSKLTPAEVIQILKDGNKDFIENQLTVRNNTKRIRATADEQYPIAVIVACMDSRIPVSDVFHRGIGDLFVIRVAGNIVNPDILGSIEYGCKVSGSKVVVILGHESCGAIEAAVEEVEMGNITGLLSKIQPAINKAKGLYKGQQTVENPHFVNYICRCNIDLALQEIQDKSPILREMEERGEIIITGAIYDMHTGKVDFFNE